MDLPVEYVYNLDKNVLNIPRRVRMIFLCGVVYRRADPKDKRKILKEYLSTDKRNFPIILEENFIARGYTGIDIGNLNDVEILVACFADAVVIIHESIATGAELGMFATNKNIAAKLLVVYPDSDSVEEDKINKFIDEAFFGYNPIITHDDNLISYRPVIREHYLSNDRYMYHTYFSNNLSTSSSMRDFIDDFIDKQSKKLVGGITFVEAKYNKSRRDMSTVDYYVDAAGELVVFVSPPVLRELLFSLLTIESARSSIESGQSISEVITAIQSKLEMIVSATIKPRIDMSFGNTKIVIKGIENSTFKSTSKAGYRKSVGLFIYLLKATGFLSIEESEGKEAYMFTRRFSSVRDSYSGTVIRKVPSKFSRRNKGLL